MEVQIAELQNEPKKVKKTLEECLSSEKARMDTRVQEVTADLRQLAHDTHQALTDLGSAKEKIRQWEEWAERQKRDGEGQKGKSLRLPKNMIPTKLSKQDDWRRWKGEVEDYYEEIIEGMKAILEKTANQK